MRTLKELSRNSKARFLTKRYRYPIFRKDRNKNGGGILFYINEDIPFKAIESNTLPGNLEILTLEIILD